MAPSLDDNLSPRRRCQIQANVLILGCLSGSTLVFGVHLRPPKKTQVARGVQVRMKGQIGWLAFLTALTYEAIQLIPSRVFNHAVSSIASAVWGT